MRKMFNLIVEISDNYMKQLMEKTRQFPQDVELKDLTHKYVIQFIIHSISIKFNYSTTDTHMM